MKKKIAVVGGGLAGLFFIHKLKSKLSVNDFKEIEITIFDKKKEFGDNIRCAQGLSLRWFKKYIPNYEDFVINYVHEFEINSYKSHISNFSQEGEGAIINRAKFEKHLGETLPHSVEVCLSEYVQSVIRVNDGFSLLTNKGKYVFDFIVAADGVESRVAKSLDMFRGYNLEDIDVCAFKLIRHDDIDEKLLRFYLGTEIAPGGYLWVFPQGADYANVGVVVDGKSALKKTPKEYLDEYLKDNYVGAEICSDRVGAIPTPSNSKPMVADGVITVGDAGFGVNPISRAGIIEALSMANIAAEYYAKAVENNDFSLRYFRQYQKRWSKLKGRYYPYLHKLKIITKALDHRTLVSYKNVIDKIPYEKRTMWKVLRMYLIRNPWVLWKMRKFWL